MDLMKTALGASSRLRRLLIIRQWLFNESKQRYGSPGHCQVGAVDDAEPSR
jgi:hypothetical protein